MELSISIEETNVLRKRVGLALIPIPRSIKTETTETQEIIKTGSNKSYNSSLSVEETNKLRNQLGLPLIPLVNDNVFVKGRQDSEYSNYLKLQHKQDELNKVEDFKLRLQQAKDDMKNRKIKENKTVLDDAKSDTRTDKEWLLSLGKKKPKSSKTSKKKPLQISPSGTESLEDFTVKHDQSNFNDILQNGNDVVLTLKDKGVYDDDISEDELENQNLKESLKVQKNLKERANKNKVDLEQEFKNPSLYDNEKSTIKEGSFKLTDLNNNQTIQKSEFKQKKKRKLITFDDDDSDNSQSELKSDYRKVSKKKFKKLNKSQSQNQRAERPDIEIDVKELKTVELINDDLDVNDNNELSNFIAVTRRKKQQTRKIEDIIVADGDAKEYIKPEKSNTEGLIINEEMEFLDSIKLNENNVNAEIQSTEEESQRRDKNMDHKQEELLESPIDYLADFMYSDPASKMTSSMGLSHTLNLLKSEQRPTSGKTTNGKSIKLSYHDDEGNELDIKSAFKYQSQKFHGFKKKR